jgi:ATP-dependent Clp endopeptidase proteolytic subunit ClpP
MLIKNGKKLVKNCDQHPEMNEEEKEKSDYQTINEKIFSTRRLVLAPNGQIDTEMFANLSQAMYLLEADNPEEPIFITMNNGGGSLYDGLAIYDRIRTSPCPVIIEFFGQCMSAATIILQAADLRLFSANCTMMIHYGTLGYDGTPNQFQQWSAESKRIQETVHEIMLQKMRGRNKQKRLDEMLKTDTILTADQALELGFIDGIIQPIHKQIQRVSIDKFSKM